MSTTPSYKVRRVSFHIPSDPISVPNLSAAATNNYSIHSSDEKLFEQLQTIENKENCDEMNIDSFNSKKFDETLTLDEILVKDSKDVDSISSSPDLDTCSPDLNVPRTSADLSDLNVSRTSADLNVPRTADLSDLNVICTDISPIRSEISETISKLSSMKDKFPECTLKELYHHQRELQSILLELCVSMEKYV